MGERRRRRWGDKGGTGVERGGGNVGGKRED